MNSILKTTVLVFFFSFLLQDYCYGQTNAGRFTFDGRGEANVATAKKDLDPYAFLEAEVGYVFFDRFLATELYQYETLENVNRFNQRYAVRYSIVRVLPVELFTGLAFTRSDTWYTREFGFIGEEPPFRIHEIRGRFVSFFGSSYFLSPTVAIEARVELPIPDINNNFDESGDLEFHLGFRYFLDSKTKKKILAKDTSFAKKRMLGISLDLIDRGNLDLYDSRKSFDFAIDFAYVSGKRGMVGIRNRLVHMKRSQLMTIEISPFGRFYFLGLQKSKLYVEVQMYFNLFRFNVPSKINTILSETSLFNDAHLGLGWSRKLSDSLRLDFFTGLKLYESLNEGRNTNPFFKSSDRILKCRLGIERYF